MTNDYLPELLEIEYSFNSGGHNSLKLLDGRLFFFAEADSNLSEENEYLTMVSIPQKIKWKHFWKDLDQFKIWDWDENYQSAGDASKKQTEDISGENIPEVIPADADIWQVKIIYGKKRISSKSWSSRPESKDEFFKAVQKLVGVDICLPFMILSKKISSE